MITIGILFVLSIGPMLFFMVGPMLLDELMPNQIDLKNKFWIAGLFGIVMFIIMWVVRMNFMEYVI